jgi:hypothetical protein
MGCGCGGGRRNVSSSARNALQPGRLSSGVNARQVQVQSNQRQALIQSARERISQANGQQIQSLGSVNPAQNLSVGEQEAERKRRIQISLRSRNTRRG